MRAAISEYGSVLIAVTVAAVILAIAVAVLPELGKVVEPVINELMK